MKSKKRLLQKIEKLRARNNHEWMRLVSLGLQCDETKAEVKDVMKRILQNDGAISRQLKKLTAMKTKKEKRPRA
jgi:hypothetical protein